MSDKNSILHLQASGYMQKHGIKATFIDLKTGKEIVYLGVLKLVDESSVDGIYAIGGNAALRGSLLKFKKPTVEVVCAIILDDDNHVLLGKRSVSQGHQGFWELPGGKVENNEDYTEAIKREIMEELGCEVQVNCLYDIYDYEYDDKIVEISAYICRMVEGSVISDEHEHEELGWFHLDDVHQLNLLPSNVTILKDMNLEMYDDK